VVDNQKKMVNGNRIWVEIQFYHTVWILVGGRNMGNKQKVTIIVDATILKEIDKLSKSQGESRSRLIEDAIRV